MKALLYHVLHKFLWCFMTFPSKSVKRELDIVGSSIKTCFYFSPVFSCFLLHTYATWDFITKVPPKVRDFLKMEMKIKVKFRIWFRIIDNNQDAICHATSNSFHGYSFQTKIVLSYMGNQILIDSLHVGTIRVKNETVKRIEH